MRPGCALVVGFAAVLLVSGVGGTASVGVGGGASVGVGVGSPVGSGASVDAGDGGERLDELDGRVVNDTLDGSGEGILPEHVPDTGHITEEVVGAVGTVETGGAATRTSEFENRIGVTERFMIASNQSADGSERTVGNRNEDRTGTGNRTAGPTDGDDDGLDDSRERALGTDPESADTDGDGLVDGAEYYGRTAGGAELPEADPLSKDLYVQLDYARGVRDHDARFVRRVAVEFAAMPVENPDNSTGIDLHVRRGRLNESAAFTGENFWNLKDRYYAERLGPRAGAYHHVVILPFAQQGIGKAGVGGEFAVVSRAPPHTIQKNAVVHELLHNVVGRIDAERACPDDPAHYCADGWLQDHVTHPEDEYLPQPIAAQIERDGFAS